MCEDKSNSAVDYALNFELDSFKLKRPHISDHAHHYDDAAIANHTRPNVDNCIAHGDYNEDYNVVSDWQLGKGAKSANGHRLNV